VVRFPAGRWVDFWTGDVIEGPLTLAVDAPLERIPLFLRAGTLMPVQLSGQLTWGASMTGNRVSALVVTAPTAMVTAYCWETPTAGATFTAAPTRDGFTLQLAGRPDTRYLLIYGSDIAKVTVNGDLLPLLQGDEITACPPGWYAAVTHVVVRLPYGNTRAIDIKLTR
jgi:hypothetical protein